jgi:hypothetical protein
MTKGDKIRSFSDVILAEWLTRIEEKAIEHQHTIKFLSHEAIKEDWIDFLKEEDDADNS